MFCPNSTVILVFTDTCVHLNPPAQTNSLKRYIWKALCQRVALIWLEMTACVVKKSVNRCVFVCVSGVDKGQFSHLRLALSSLNQALDDVEIESRWLPIRHKSFEVGGKDLSISLCIRQKAVQRGRWGPACSCNGFQESTRTEKERAGLLCSDSYSCPLQGNGPVSFRPPMTDTVNRGRVETQSNAAQETCSTNSDIRGKNITIYKLFLSFESGFCCDRSLLQH